MGIVEHKSDVPRRKGYYVNTPEGMFIYNGKKWCKLIFDAENSSFDVLTGKMVTVFKFED